MDEEKIRMLFAELGIVDTITCPQAFAVADKNDLSKVDIARYCNTHGVKIRGCQLGCFK
ncbi:MAG: hypothetical protein NT074_06170 [Methanomicrobiales archaeon]|jgi:hypothetical protein|nr:hypothetical protein [Methanomicrobiales archaeon]